MRQSAPNIYIVGSGISGLIAALVLEEQGYSPVVIESTEGIGGRVKTEYIDGYALDIGFQVLLTAYPAVNKYLDLDKLDLQKLKPGATIFTKGKTSTIGDALRDKSLFWLTLFSGAGSVLDKLKVLKLTKTLKKKSIEDIFKSEEQTTTAYLEALGFSQKFFKQFFKPFFSGIFLESELQTSSRMFEFIYKMFSEGYAAIPKNGMQAIPEQLKNRLKNTSFTFNTKVKYVRDGEIELDNGECLKSDFTIVATEPSGIIRNLRGQSPEWKFCEVLYFETLTRKIENPIIGLIPDSDALINHVFYPTSVNTSTSTQNELLSVTIVKSHTMSDEALIPHIENELKVHCGIDVHRFIKRYTIPQALPILQEVRYSLSPSEVQLTSGIVLAGDTLLNGSLNAAIISGENAAQQVISQLNNM